MTGSRSTAGGLVEHHQMTINCSRCSRELSWQRDVAVKKVMAVEVKKKAVK
jgi:hypothetical protein